MRKFHFRLQRILNYRKSLEQARKLAYLSALAERQRAEAYLFALKVRRDECLSQSAHNPLSLIERLELQEYITRLDEKIEEQKTLLLILKEDENIAREKWNEARKASKVLQRLKEHARNQWQQETNREEQKQLDEFATSRKNLELQKPKLLSQSLTEHNPTLPTGGSL